MTQFKSKSAIYAVVLVLTIVPKAGTYVPGSPQLLVDQGYTVAATTANMSNGPRFSPYSQKFVGIPTSTMVASSTAQHSWSWQYPKDEDFLG